MKIGIIGGTGPQGKGLALRFAKSGVSVSIGSRSEERAKSIANDLNDIISSTLISGMSNQELVRSIDIIFLTIPFETVKNTITPLLNDIKQYTKVLVDVTVPLQFEKGKGMVYVIVEEGNMSLAIQKMISPVPVVGAFKTIGAHALLDIERLLDRDTFVLGPKESRKEIIDLISKIETLRALDSGPLREATTVERLVPFLININRRYKIKDSGLKVVM